MAKKDAACPRCGSKDIAEILYGLVPHTDKLQEKARKGKVVFAGCVITANDPGRRCNACGHRFGKRGA